MEVSDDTQQGLEESEVQEPQKITREEESQDRDETAG